MVESDLASVDVRVATDYYRAENRRYWKLLNPLDKPDDDDDDDDGDVRTE